MSSPDPDHDSAQLIELFLLRLGHELTASGLDADGRHALVERIRRYQRELFAADEAGLPDAPARYNRRYTTTLVAAYRIVSRTPGMPSGSALVTCLTRAFVEPLAGAVTAGTRAMLDASPDPFAAMVAVARARERADFGTEFAFAHPVDDGARFVADVRRCGYHEYLRAQGLPQLTAVLCAFDANWIAAIDPDRHGFAFSRVTTIGHGGPSCPFDFRRTDR